VSTERQNSVELLDEADLGLTFAATQTVSLTNNAPQASAMKTVTYTAYVESTVAVVDGYRTVKPNSPPTIRNDTGYYQLNCESPIYDGTLQNMPEFEWDIKLQNLSAMDDFLVSALASSYFGSFELSDFVGNYFVNSSGYANRTGDFNLWPYVVRGKYHPVVLGAENFKAGFEIVPDAFITGAWVHCLLRFEYDDAWYVVLYMDGKKMLRQSWSNVYNNKPYVASLRLHPTIFLFNSTFANKGLTWPYLLIANVRRSSLIEV
jgi:hypothetical protein